MGMLASFWLSVHRVSELVTDVFQKTWRELEFDIELKHRIETFDQFAATQWLLHSDCLKIEELHFTFERLF